MKNAVLAAILGACTLAGAAQATVINLDFEGAGNSVALNDFYNGGTDAAGNSGINYGVGFGSNSLSIVDEDAGGTGNIANEPSGETVLFFLTGSAILNYALGFTDGFSFFYSSNGAADVSVYDGLNATGNVIGSISLADNWDKNCSGDPTGAYCNWDVGSLAFSAIAKSIDFGGTVNRVAYDNITFGATDPTTQSTQVAVVPLPAAGWLFLSGLAGLAGIRAKRRIS